MADFTTSIASIAALRTWWDSTVPGTIPSGDRYIAELDPGEYLLGSVSQTWGSKTTTGSTAQIIIRPATAGKLTNTARALRFGASDGVRLILPNSDVDFAAFRVDLQGLQIQNASGAVGRLRVVAYSYLTGCIVSEGALGIVDIGNTLRDCVVLGNSASALFTTPQPSTTLEGNTFINFGSGVAVTLTQAAVCKNNVFISMGGSVAVDGAGGFAGGSTNNSFYGTGSGGTNATTITPASEFTNVSSLAAADMRLLSGSTIKTSGAAGVGSGSDVYWQTRSGTPARGAIEFITASAPTIDTQPAAQSVTAPSTATFSASVSGTYTGLQWERQAAGAGAWANVSGGTGGTTTSYTTGATSVSGGSFNSTDRFRLRVDWSGGSVYSNDVALTVGAAGTAPSITSQPSNASVTQPATNTFSVTASGSGTLSYQWQLSTNGGSSWADISGATSASYTTPATAVSSGSAQNGYQYRCVVTGDTAPPAASSAATLTVLYPVATTVSLTLYGADGTTPAASLTNLKWAFYDQATPDLFTTAPVAKGAVETTDGSGVFSASITGTALRQNDIGYLIVTNSDGTVTQGAALKAFAAPVVVS